MVYMYLTGLFHNLDFFGLGVGVSGMHFFLVNCGMDFLLVITSNFLSL